MNARIRLALACTLLSFAVPLQAQDGNHTMGYFVTTNLAHVMQLEEGMREHVGWHVDQNDPWPGFMYQAMHGGIEYGWVSPGHTWADFDNPPIDMHADMADFAQNAGEHVLDLDVRTWTTWSDVSLEPAPDAVVPIWQVMEFDFKATEEGRQAVMSAMAKVKAVMEQAGARYTVNEVVGADSSPQLFIGLAHETMGEMDEMGGDAFASMLAQAYGHADAIHIIRTFEAYMTPLATRVWTLRPDLSHMPGM